MVLRADVKEPMMLLVHSYHQSNCQLPAAKPLQLLLLISDQLFYCHSVSNLLLLLPFLALFLCI